MPSKKTFVVLIVCIGIITSVWILSRKVPEIKKLAGVDLISEALTQNSKSDWQKILVSVDQSTTTVVSNQATYGGEGTVTDQLAKDFFAQYLLLKQGGSTVTAEQADQIAQNTLSNYSYTKTDGVIYTSNNLHLIESSKNNSLKYMNDGVKILTNHPIQNPENALTILSGAVKTGKENDLAKLDPIISNYKNIISDALGINVPKDAVSIHIDLLNSISSVLANIEAMRATFTDPVKSFAGLSQYKQHVADMYTALKKINDYFLSKGLLR